MVHFIGAGPGDPELITRKGARLLREAEIVIYGGSLVNPALLEECRPDARIYDSKDMDLDEVCALYLEAAQSGANVARLHTGDPSLYGAIREQMDFLKAHSIDYDVCPGVSAFCGAAAALQTEYTLPGVTQTVIISRAEGRTPVPEREQLAKLAAHQATMVLFSVGNPRGQGEDRASRRWLSGEHADRGRIPCILAGRARGAHDARKAAGGLRNVGGAQRGRASQASAHHRRPRHLRRDDLRSLEALRPGLHDCVSTGEYIGIVEISYDSACYERVETACERCDVRSIEFVNSV